MTYKTQYSVSELSEEEYEPEPAVGEEHSQIDKAGDDVRMHLVIPEQER